MDYQWSDLLGWIAACCEVSGIEGVFYGIQG